MIVDIIRLCSTCRQSRSIEFFKENGVTCAICRERHLNRRNRVEIKIKKYKQDAARRGKTFNLSDETARFLLTHPCAYCGFWSSVKLNGIDRRDNSKGYTEDNCVSCCDVCNFGKGTKTEAEFIHMCIRVAKHHNFISRNI